MELYAVLPAARPTPFLVPGGLIVAELESTLREIGRNVPIRAAAVTAYAPQYDSDGRVARAALRVVESLVAAVQ